MDLKHGRLTADSTLSVASQESQSKFLSLSFLSLYPSQRLTLPTSTAGKRAQEGSSWHGGGVEEFPNKNKGVSRCALSPAAFHSMNCLVGFWECSIETHLHLSHPCPSPHLDCL